MSCPTWKLTVERQSINRLPERTTVRQLKEIRSAVERNETYGFKAKLAMSAPPEPTEMYIGPVSPENRRLLYKVTLRVKKPRFRSEEAAERQFMAMCGSLARTCNARGWRLISPLDNEIVAAEPASESEDPSDVVTERPSFTPQVLTTEAKASFFRGIYDRENQLSVIEQGIRATVARNMNDPSHFLLYGPPSGAKTRLFKGLKAFYEQDEVERVVIMDATTASKAGLENWLLQRARAQSLPVLLVLEEVEKHKPENLLCLLSVMASGEIARTNCNVERSGREEAKLMIGATCNDEEILRTFHKGALWSRFAPNHLYCPRPNREQMLRILLDRIEQRNGNPAWAAPVLSYAYDEVNNDDPRFILGLLDGEAGLLDGSFLEHHRAIRMARINDLKRRGLINQARLDEALAVIRDAMEQDRGSVLRSLGVQEAQAWRPLRGLPGASS